MLYTHFFRNVTEKPKFNQFKIIRKCFVLPALQRRAVRKLIYLCCHLFMVVEGYKDSEY